ncbi:YybH family protein [Agromyces humi]|uniref:YybH family protein n=1 Tax=Agromyces humi TaxID=1766800 RepID=UPI0013594174|nr:nuclear transport factor 2 family protein [Agromyces humi]
MRTTPQLTESAVDSAEVAWLVSKRAAAIRSRDAEYLASRYAPDAVTFGVAPPLSPFAGEARRVAWIRAWFRRFPDPIDHRVLDLTVSVAGDFAFCRSLDALVVGPPSRRRAVRFETVVGLRRVDGVWLVECERVGPATEAAGATSARARRRWLWRSCRRPR